MQKLTLLSWIRVIYLFLCGPGSVDGIATGYELDGPGIESRWGGGEIFPHLSRPAMGPTQPPVQWVPGLSPGVKSGRGVTLTPHPLLMPWSWKSRAIPLLPLWVVRPVTEPQCLYKGALYLYLFLYLYRVIKKSLCTWRLQYNHQMDRDFLIILYIPIDRLCGLVVTVSGYRYRGPGFDSRRYQIFWVVVGLERGLLSLVRSIEELLE